MTSFVCLFSINSGILKCQGKIDVFFEKSDFRQFFYRIANSFRRERKTVFADHAGTGGDKINISVDCSSDGYFIVVEKMFFLFHAVSGILFFRRPLLLF